MTESPYDDDLPTDPPEHGLSARPAPDPSAGTEPEPQPAAPSLPHAELAEAPPAPAGPPPLDLNDSLQPLDPRAVTLWRIGGGISTVVWSVVISLATVPAIYALDGQWMPVVAGALALVFVNALLRIAVIPPIRYRLWRYQLRADQLFLQRGWLVVRRTLIPLVRVQNVDTVQGPIARRFDLWSVVVFTAANAQSIPALSKEQADHLRETIAELARRARDEA